ncbi:hypothetical protein [Streptomyces sp. NPDC089799]|uniref:hypothetical protein n=1 Tax=Streptomyces sp. NPDC089799 TaxID=3155066 RepID=UPI003441B8D1
MPSTLGLAKVLEAWTWREVERLRCEGAQLALALGEVERELSRLASAREAMRRAHRALRTDLGDCEDPTAAGGADAAGGGLGGGIRVTVPTREPGMDLTALPGIYRNLAQVLNESRTTLQAHELTRLLGLEPTASSVEGVRARAKRLVARGWAVQADRGRFASSPACARADGVRRP